MFCLSSCDYIVGLLSGAASVTQQFLVHCVFFGVLIFNICLVLMLPLLGKIWLNFILV